MGSLADSGAHPFRSKASAKRGRFNFLLLDEGESYVDDWVATGTHSAAHSYGDAWTTGTRLKGRLRLGSRSVIFDPDDYRVSIYRFPLADVESIEENGLSDSGLTLTTTKVIQCKLHGRDAPYVVAKGRHTFGFALVYAPLSHFVVPARERLLLSKLATHERDAGLQALAQRMEDEFRFDTSRLVGLRERAQWEAPAQQVAPLLRERGRLLVTNQHMYFQPLHSLGGDMPVRSWALNSVVAVVRRHLAQRPLAMEVFLIAHSAAHAEEGSSVMFAFRNSEARDEALRALASQASACAVGAGMCAADASSLLEGEPTWLKRVTAAWQRGSVSNLDYVLYLNLAAGRSFNDVSQWPVVPWVLADYSSRRLDLTNPSSFRDLSKPVGALSPHRLESFRKRMRHLASTGQKPFLYGTHYSTPAYVLYWLVRAAPAHMLLLQNGRFDAPDRLFHSLADTWRSVCTNPADVKELIPEMYGCDATFLSNALGLPLGTRQDGARVGDVLLPPWTGSPQDFLAQHRAAIESEHVSLHLHNWLDLIFGYKQLGEAALAADNLFHPLSYEGGVDLDLVEDPAERAALEIQINEFGQTPRQLFTAPHPRRIHWDTWRASHLSGGAGTPEAAQSLAAGNLVLSLLRTLLAPTSTSSSRQADTMQAPIMPSPCESPPEPARNPSLKPPTCSTILTSTPLDASLGPVLSLSPVPQKSAQRHEPSPPALRALPLPPARGIGGASSSLDADDPSMRAAQPNHAKFATCANPFVSAFSAQIRNRGSASQSMPSSEAASDPTRSAVTSTALSTAETSARAATLAQSTTCPPCSTSFSSLRKQSQGALCSLSEPNARVLPGSKFMRALGSGDASESGLGASECTREPSNSPARACLRGDDRPGAGLLGEDGAPGPQYKVTLGAFLSCNWKCGWKQESGWWPLGATRAGAWRKAHSLRAHRGAVLAALVASGAQGRPLLYSGGRDAALKVTSLEDGSQVRSARLGALALSCLAHVHNTHPHPVVLAGCYDNAVYAYSVDYGRSIGRLTAHEDAVAAMRIASRQERLFTASWDATVKLWDMAEGRAFCHGRMGPPASPTSNLTEHDAAVTALDIDSDEGNMVISGDQGGEVLVWDVRQSQAVCKAMVAEGASICAVNYLPGGRHGVVAATDGTLRLIRLHYSGSVAAAMKCGTSLRCCDTDGSSVLAGAEDGSIHVWKMPLHGNETLEEAVGETIPSSPVVQQNAPINCICVASALPPLRSDVGRNTNISDTIVVTGSEDSTLRTYILSASRNYEKL